MANVMAASGSHNASLNLLPAVSKPGSTELEPTAMKM